MCMLVTCGTTWMTNKMQVLYYSFIWRPLLETKMSWHGVQTCSKLILFLHTQGITSHPKYFPLSSTILDTSLHSPLVLQLCMLDGSILSWCQNYRYVTCLTKIKIGSITNHCVHFMQIKLTRQIEYAITEASMCVWCRYKSTKDMH